VSWQYASQDGGASCVAKSPLAISKGAIEERVA
jgi:hypothetical protein